MALEPLDPEHQQQAWRAQRFLEFSHGSVSGLLETRNELRDARKEKLGSLRGRSPEREVDLLRAAVVFTGAGLDATLKQLIRDCLPALLDHNEQAQAKFAQFATQQLDAGGHATSASVAKYLTAADPRATLIEDYTKDLTGSSLQSAREVQIVAGVLGIEEAAVRKRIGDLGGLFTARNKITHELDLQHPEQQGDRTRSTRRLEDIMALCNDGFAIGQLIVNAVPDCED